MGETAAWAQAYEILQDFISSEPGIDIRETSVSIDAEVRARFYELFDNVRAAFLTEHAGEELQAALRLSHYYERLEEQVTKTLGLSDIVLSSDLNRYLHDPFKQILRELWDPLFELLQGTLESSEEFEAIGKDVLKESFALLYVRGYEKCVQIGLVQNLQPEQVYEVPLATPTSKQFIKHRPDTVHSIPPPEPSDRLVFDVLRRAPALIPDFILWSGLTGSYVGMITAVGKAIWKAGNHSSRREWLDLAELVGKFGLVELNPSALLYIDDHVEDLALVADSERLCRPDVVLDVTHIRDWVDESAVDYLRKLHLWHAVLRPNVGTFVLNSYPVPNETAAAVADGLHISELGLESFHLGPLLAALQTTSGS